MTPQEALARVGGWEDAKLTPLAGGLTNRSWLVEDGARRAVLKIDATPRHLPFSSRPDEANAQTLAAAHGLASPVIYADENVYLTEYVEGNVWRLSDFAEEESLRSLARALRKLHSLPRTGRVFDATAAMEQYLPQIGERHMDMARQCAKIVNAMPRPNDLRFCHNDLVAENIIASPAVKFLDWEYACDNDPCFDVATVIAHHNLTDAHADILVRAYSLGDTRAWPMVLDYIRFYLAFYWLWLAARPATDPTELRSLAARIRRMD